jgi:bifunctional non-homologous end joining protein LigD
LDGELVALEANGISSFTELQRTLSEDCDSRLLYYVSNLPYLNGGDLRPCALRDSKRLLAALSDWTGMLRYSDRLIGEAIGMYRHACATGWRALSASEQTQRIGQVAAAPG